MPPPPAEIAIYSAEQCWTPGLIESFPALELHAHARALASGTLVVQKVELGRKHLDPVMPLYFVFCIIFWALRIYTTECRPKMIGNTLCQQSSVPNPQLSLQQMQTQTQIQIQIQIQIQTQTPKLK